MTDRTPAIMFNPADVEIPYAIVTGAEVDKRGVVWSNPEGEKMVVAPHYGGVVQNAEIRGEWALIPFIVPSVARIGDKLYFVSPKLTWYGKNKAGYVVIEPFDETDIAHHAPALAEELKMVQGDKVTLELSDFNITVDVDYSCAQVMLTGAMHEKPRVSFRTTDVSSALYSALVMCRPYTSGVPF